MGLEDLVMQFADERIQELLSNGTEEWVEKKETDMDAMEALLEKSPPETRAEIERMITCCIDQRAEKDRLLYLSGIRDGVCIGKILLL